LKGVFKEERPKKQPDFKPPKCQFDGFKQRRAKPLARYRLHPRDALRGCFDATKRLRPEPPGDR
jgi:hypothetical protein